MVGVLLPSSIAGALANIAVLLAGKVPVNLNFTAGQKAMASAIRQCEIRTVLTSRLFLAKARVDKIEGMVFLEEIVKQTTVFQKVRTTLLGFLLPPRFLHALYDHGERDSNASTIFSNPLLKARRFPVRLIAPSAKIQATWP